MNVEAGFADECSGAGAEDGLVANWNNGADVCGCVAGCEKIDPIPMLVVGVAEGVAGCASFFWLFCIGWAGGSQGEDVGLPQEDPDGGACLDCRVEL